MSDSTESKQIVNVLIVDDDSDCRFPISKAMEDLGWVTHKASNGLQAIATYELIKPDLILLDLMMPERSGFLVLEHIRTEACDAVPIIVMSGIKGTIHRKYAKQLGISDFVTKPFQMPALIKIAQEAVAKTATD